MESFSRADFHIGGLAIIIGCEDQANRWTIGRVVTVEGFVYVNDPFPKYLLAPQGLDSLAKSPDLKLDKDCAVISAEFIDVNQPYWNPGMALIQIKHLMPIQTDSDDVFEKEENPYLESIPA